MWVLAFQEVEDTEVAIFSVASTPPDLEAIPIANVGPIDPAAFTVPGGTPALAAVWENDGSGFAQLRLTFPAGTFADPNEVFVGDWDGRVRGANGEWLAPGRIPTAAFV
jgi:hypothetical protein